MITTVYRLEDINGYGPYYKLVKELDMINKFNKDIFYGFIDKKSFLDPDYFEFYKSKDYVFYKIELRSFIDKSPSGEVQFYKKDIISKKIESLEENNPLILRLEEEDNQEDFEDNYWKDKEGL